MTTKQIFTAHNEKLLKSLIPDKEIVIKCNSVTDLKDFDKTIKENGL